VRISTSPANETCDFAGIKQFVFEHEAEALMNHEHSLRIQTLGDLKVFASGRELAIPPSRKTRSLLGYLLLSGVPQRRERLCELFWDGPDDPRAALRWSLSKLRGVLKDDAPSFLMADRERVALDVGSVVIDIRQILQLADDERASAHDLETAWKSCRQLLLQDSDLPDLSAFSAWLQRERLEITRLRTRLARRLANMETLPPEEAIGWSDAWLEDAPFDRDAAVCAIATRLRAGRVDAADSMRTTLHERFLAANLKPPRWPDETPQDQPPTDERAVYDRDTDRALRIHQRVRFVQADDGASLAWASVGADEAPPLVKAANWLSHLELDWEAPIWSPLFRELARTQRLIRYDERGCGLSDWNVPEISFETFVTDLETVVDAAGLERFPLLGISQGASVSIEYAIRHPERVSHLILFGGYAAGWRHIATPEETREREAIMVLTEAGWGRDDPAYRHLFSTSFMPSATSEELGWFDEFQRRTTSARNAVRFLEAFSRIDVRHRLAELRVPTLVLHSRGDRRIPFETGRQIAASIPGAEFVGLDSDNHLLLGREAASIAFLAAVREFLAR
jgi:pimeloyl-ACP methyl ester carboxylesterase/DNA-binding SARP family transcriptional activator